MARDKLEGTYVHFPDDWKLIQSSGVGSFVTRAVHRLPNGSEHIWTARRHRKGRGAGGKGSPWLQFWAPEWISWWIAVGLIIGCVLYAVGAGSSLLGGALGPSPATRMAD